MNITETIINFEVYEDAVSLVGTAEVSLPEISQKIVEITGAGIAGSVDAVIPGHLDAMTTTFNFKTITPSAITLLEPRDHKIDLRAPQQVRDTATGTLKTQAVKHVLVMRPKKLSLGKAAPTSPADASGEYATSYLATYIDGKKVLEADPLNYIFFVNGKDYLATVRKALGR